jgi:DNA-binding XRE family transcriptional regulator
LVQFVFISFHRNDMSKENNRIEETIALSDLKAVDAQGASRRDSSNKEAEITLKLIITAAEIAKEARASTKMRMTAFAKKARIRPHTLSLIENAQNCGPPNLTTLARIADAAGKKLKIALGD